MKSNTKVPTMEATLLITQKSNIEPAHQLKWQRIILLTILGYEGAGALLGGAFLIARPDGGLMDMPVGIMHGAFSNFLIPGIILLGLGILNVFSFASVFRRSESDWLMAGVALGGLLIWFVVEIVILQELHWLHLMWGIPVLLGWIVTLPLVALRKPEVLTRKVLLSCGILSSIWYVAVNIYVPLQYEGYNLSSFTVSELSAIGAPTRILWVLLVVLYPLLFSTFGWGILQTGTGNRPLRIIGALVIAYCIFNLYWPPMHMRGNGPTLTDTLHIAWAMTTILLMMAMMGFGAAALGKQFRIYTIISIALHVGFGALTSLTAPNIPTNGPTPLIGIWERINIAVFMLWIAVLAVILIRRENSKNTIQTHT
jgi:hypothetical protein